MKEKKKTKKIIVLCILIPVLLVTAAVAGVAVSLVSGYIRNACEGREIEPLLKAKLTQEKNTTQ